MRGLGSRGQEWLWGLVAVNLLGHVALDGLNCVRRAPVLSVRARWYYGDAVFVFEPVVWLVLGVAAACNAETRRVRTSIVCLLVVVFVAITAGGLIPPVALVANLAAAGAFLAAIRHLRPRPRAAAALVVMTVFVLVDVRFVESGEARSHQGVTDDWRSTRRDRVAGSRHATVLVRHHRGT